MLDLAAPTGSGLLLATTPDGLLVSDDDGMTFSPFEPQPPTRLLHVEPVGERTTARLNGVDTDGQVWLSGPDGWTQVGSIGGPVTAFAVADAGVLLAATEEAVLRSSDGGASWSSITELVT